MDLPTIFHFNPSLYPVNQLTALYTCPGGAFTSIPRHDREKLRELHVIKLNVTHLIFGISYVSNMYVISNI